MQNEAELHFFRKLLEQFHVNFRILGEHDGPIPELDLGLRRLLNPDTDYLLEFQRLCFLCKPQKIYKIRDEFFCHYFFFQLPENTNASYVLIGPYRLSSVSTESLLENAKKLSLPDPLLLQLQLYYQSLTTVSDEQFILTALYVLCSGLFGGMDAFSFQEIHQSASFDYHPVAKRPVPSSPEETLFSMKFLEERYHKENMLIQAVSKGQIHKAEMFLHALPAKDLEPRTSDSLRNVKNYTIILNTLLRKAAEAGTVHPLHIDSLSSRFAHQIEALTSEEDAFSLQKEMAHKYCLLVKNHSMKGYSLLIRKALTHIDSDLTADLSLKSLAELLGVNSSYLSTLFRKETGSTLTEYVNRKRVEHAIFLLNSTNLQIQEIATACGISDVNYFTKIFKKQVGNTPKEYREKIF